MTRRRSASSAQSGVRPKTPHPPAAEPDEALDPGPDGEEELRALCAEYARTLPRQIELLAEAVRRARAATNDPTATANARARAHRLWGTAGCYGFAEVSQAARRIEEALRSAETADPRDEAVAWDQVARDLAAATADAALPPALQVRHRARRSS